MLFSVHINQNGSGRLVAFICTDQCLRSMLKGAWRPTCPLRHGSVSVYFSIKMKRERELNGRDAYKRRIADGNSEKETGFIHESKNHRINKLNFVRFHRLLHLLVHLSCTRIVIKVLLDPTYFLYSLQVAR